jgi:hypothetical protein
MNFQIRQIPVLIGLKVSMLKDSERIALLAKRVPGLYDAVPSNGTPKITVLARLYSIRSNKNIMHLRAAP